MKIVCDICGKEQDVVGSIDEVDGPYSQKRWMVLRSMQAKLEKVLCGGGLFEYGAEHECLAKEVESFGGVGKFYFERTIEIFYPVKGVLPKDVKKKLEKEVGNNE